MSWHKQQVRKVLYAEWHKALISGQRRWVHTAGSCTRVEPTARREEGAKAWAASEDTRRAASDKDTVRRNGAISELGMYFSEVEDSL